LVVDTACVKLLLDHVLTLSRKIGSRRWSLATSGRCKHSNNQKPHNASHLEE
jgi:hypothetical protein